MTFNLHACLGKYWTCCGSRSLHLKCGKFRYDKDEEASCGPKEQCVGFWIAHLDMSATEVISWDSCKHEMDTAGFEAFCLAVESGGLPGLCGLNLSCNRIAVSKHTAVESLVQASTNRNFTLQL
jgi:hypothetical protein